ncbi:MAG: FISUMP domain-containing protein [Candidatus Gracilibacteria bacterium]|nr:FISUMP domain-containing protein [Candidatus Gracilibacteria bacterium]
MVKYKNKASIFRHFPGKGKNLKGFTLVELIVVITILAILGTIAFISLQGYSTSARDSTRVSDLSSMKTSLELFQLDAGNYPKPTGLVSITYSGTTVWNQGTFGETVFANLGKLDKIPKDPLTDKEYTYSVLVNGNQYQLGGIVEGNDISYRPPLTPPYQGGGLAQQVQAGIVEATAYITGNYNGQMTKVLSGTTCNVLAVPSIINNDATVTDLQQIVASGSLVYRGFKNLPASFKGSKFNEAAGFDFQPNTLLAYTDTSSCAPLTDNTSYTARVNLLKGLQDAYSGTLVQNEGEIKNILALTIDTNSPSQEVINYAGNYVNNVLKGKVSTGGGSQTITYSNCESGTLNGYNYGAIIHNQTEAVTKTGSLSNGILNYGADALCTDGVVTIQNELTNIDCSSGFVEQAGACVQDICGSTVPANAHSTATSQSNLQSWTHNTTPAVCTFVCDNNYTWNGSSCTANTQTTSCTSLPSNAVWNTASSITQTWSGTNWLPTESGDYNTSASTTECRYQCASNYTWNGSSCVANTQSVSCGGSVPANATATTGTNYTQTWNGSDWSPTTSWGESQATCDFNCNSGYSWNGTSCVQNNSCNSTQPTNAILTIGSPTSPNQAWQNTNSANPCYYTCSGGYGWNGTSCILASNCTTGLTEITLTNGQTWSCMNLGATTVWDGSTQPTNCGGSSTNCNSLTWLGSYYQWGRNDTGWTNGQSGSPYNYGWEAQNDTKWGGSTSDTTASDGAGTTAIGRQGPCPSGWHVPSVKDWQLACNNILSTTCSNGMSYNSLIASKLRLPFAGNRYSSNGKYYDQSTNAGYWSSTPNSIYAYYLRFNTSLISPAYSNYRAYGFSVRCLKN